MLKRQLPLSWLGIRTQLNEFSSSDDSSSSGNGVDDEQNVVAVGRTASFADSFSNFQTNDYLTMLQNADSSEDTEELKAEPEQHSEQFEKNSAEADMFMTTTTTTTEAAATTTTSTIKYNR